MDMARKTVGAILLNIRGRVKMRLAEILGYRFLLIGQHRYLQDLNRDSSVHSSALHETLVKHLPSRPGFYVELGANDGVTGSNTLFLELFRGWRGLLIEPVSESFRLLSRNRSSKRNHLVRAACVSFGYASNWVEIAVANLMSTPLGLDSDISDPIAHATAGLTYSKHLTELRIEKVPAATLTEILREHRGPRVIDFLSLDVEGAELEVLKGVDFLDFEIRLILVEAREPDRIIEFLAVRDYILLAQASPIDYLFSLQPRDHSLPLSTKAVA